MIPGLEKDDRYRMVEDEFLAVARRFTTHLHRAEYARLRTLAASQNAAAIREVERPVIAGARQNPEARRRGDAKRREIRQRSVVGEGGGAMTGLRGLLESPRKDRRSIGKGLGRHGARTRAGIGAGVGSTQGHVRRQETGDETADETADEPELPPLRLASTAKLEEASSRRTELSTRGVAGVAQSPNAASTAHRVNAVIEIDDDDDDPFGITRRKARREKSREQLRRTEAAVKSERDTMPSFL